MKNKEAIYDEKIYPLMAQVIAICKEHKIAAVCDFQLDEDLHCTTALTTAEYSPSEEILAAVRALRPVAPICIAETHTTKPDGSKHISIRRIS